MPENKNLINNDGIVTGKFTTKEEKFIRENFHQFTDEEMARSLNRNRLSITNKRIQMKLGTKKEAKIKDINKFRGSYIASLDESEKNDFYRKELHGSSTYKSVKDILNLKELDFYENKYIDFMTDPTIETMTAMEKDTWHEMVMAQIRIIRYMREEKDSNSGQKISRSREIAECQKIVQDCQKSLNVERSQRLKNQSDTAINFTSIIRELKDPTIRRQIGYEAAMLKYIAEKYYNKHLGTNIISGKDDMYALSILFKDEVEPSGLSGEFI